MKVPFRYSVLIAFLQLFFVNTSFASMDKAWDYLIKSKGTVKYYPVVVQELVRNGFYFASVPYIKEFLVRTNGVKSAEIDNLIDEVITAVGVKQFEVLPTKFLAGTKAPTVQYILAKKYFRLGQYNKALETLNASIPKGHPAKPFALFLEGSALSILGNTKSAVAAYKECISRSESWIGKNNSDNRNRQLKINRDYCIVGIARSEFAAKEHEKANLSYLDLSKSSHIWPEILFEEAWNSFYMKDYNRTLGKLVTYKAPILKYIFNPEIEVLKGLTYLQLCLWDDTRKVVNDFYNEYEAEYKGLGSLLKKKGKDYKYFYLLAKSRQDGKVRGNELLNRLLGAIIRDATYLELYDSFLKGRDELEKAKTVSNTRFKQILNINLKDSLILQRNLIGAYVRKQLYLYRDQMSTAFQNMSYMNLEVLSHRKSELYGHKTEARERGDIKYLKRNDKQYFWSFNGEFWADELGDYVFSLKSECN